jgi:hypothetical protein
MRLVSRHQGSPAVLERGDVVDGYLVDGRARGGERTDVRYTVLTGDGERATLVMSRRPLVNRHERARFRQLAKLRTEFSHPAALEVMDFGEHSGHAYLVTAPLPRQTLGDLLREEHRLEPQRVVSMLTPVAAALDAAHARGLVHRALGTETLFVTRRDRLLLDWFSLFESGDEAEWWGVGTWGDMRYRPPEQLRGRPLAPSENLYSLTAVIVHALSGEPPYAGEPAMLGYAHLADSPPRLSERVPELDEAVDGVVWHGLEKDPRLRPPSATALLADLAKAVGTELPEAPAEAPAAAGEPARRRPRRRRRGIRVAAIAALAAAAGAVVGVAAGPFDDDAATAPPRPSPAVWKRLDAERADLRTELAAAKTPQEQADVAGRLAGAYEDAARAAGPGGQARAARAVGVAYTDLAAAAESGEQSGYSEASDAIAEAEQRLQTRR